MEVGNNEWNEPTQKRTKIDFQLIRFVCRWEPLATANTHTILLFRFAGFFFGFSFSLIHFVPFIVLKCIMCMPESNFRSLAHEFNVERTLKAIFQSIHCNGNGDGNNDDDDDRHLYIYFFVDFYGIALHSTRWAWARARVYHFIFIFIVATHTEPAQINTLKLTYAMQFIFETGNGLTQTALAYSTHNIVHNVSVLLCFSLSLSLCRSHHRNMGLRVLYVYIIER